VSSAVLSTIYNRWATARRFQRRAQLCNRCVLVCPGDAEDSIEHYVRCHAVRSFASSFLNLSFSHADAVEEFVLASECTRWTANTRDLSMLAILIYSVYRATNAARAQGNVSPTFAKQMLGQYAKEAVRGHRMSSQLLDRGWICTNVSRAGQPASRQRSRSPRR
jgi:hypothetical protein